MGAGTIRKPAVAGQFYPAEKRELSGLISSCFKDERFGPGGELEENSRVVAGLVPHAGYVYSGPCAARFYSLLPKGKFKTVVLLGPNHTGLGEAVSISAASEWETPLGKIPVNAELSRRLSEESPLFRVESSAHAQEHAIEVQLPFLQHFLGEGFSILPISVADSRQESCKEIGKALAKCADKRTLLIASSDLNHYEGREATREKDELAISALLSLSAENLREKIRKNGISMCGVLPATCLLFALEEIGVKRARLLGHYISSDIIASAEDRAVGYCSVAFL